MAGSDGTYRLPNIVVGRAVDLWAASEGFAEQAVGVLLREPKETRLDFALPRGLPLTIVVFDVETGSPLADAELYRYPGIGEPFARTDGDGRVDMRIVDGSELRLVVKAVGYCSFMWIWDVAGTEKLTPRIPMLGLAWIEGTIRGSDGEAVQDGASAVIDGLSSNQRDLTQEDRQAHGLPGRSWYEVDRRDRTGTDANGHFVLAVLPSDEPYQLMVKDRKHAPARAGPFLLDSPGMRTSVMVRLEPGATVQGRVVHNGEPWTNGFVVAKDSAGTDIVRDLSDGEGKYELGGLPTGEIRLRLRDWWGDVKGPEVTFVAEANGEYRQDIIWKEDVVTIAGRVTERSGRPLAGVNIVAAHDGPGERHFASSKSEDDGRYVLVVRPSLTYDVTVHSGPVTERRAGITAGAEGVDFVLSAIGKLRLRLVDSGTGEPLRGALSRQGFLAWRPSGEEAFHRLSGAPDAGDAEGLLELDLPVGMVDVSLTLVDEGYTPRKLYGLSVAEQAGDPVTVELERGVSATLTFEAESERGGEQTRGHLILVVEESQLGAVRGPFPSEGGPSNMRVNGVNMWLGEPGLLKRLLDPMGNEARHLGGLAPGRYWLRAFPDAFVFEPESFVVSDEDVRVTLRWRWR